MKTRIDVNTLNSAINHSPASGDTFAFWDRLWDRPQQFFLREFRNGLREARAEILTKVKNGQLRNSLWMENNVGHLHAENYNINIRARDTLNVHLQFITSI